MKHTFHFPSFLLLKLKMRFITGGSSVVTHSLGVKLSSLTDAARAFVKRLRCANGNDYEEQKSTTTSAVRACTVMCWVDDRFVQGSAP